MAVALFEHLAQCAAQNDGGEVGSASRDRSLADNVLGLLGPSANASGSPKVVVLAHNGHVARERIGADQHAPMGEHLANRLGRAYFATEFLLGTGSFRAQEFDPKKGYAPGLKELSLDGVAPGSMEDVFSRAVSSEANSPCEGVREVKGEAQPTARARRERCSRTSRLGWAAPRSKRAHRSVARDTPHVTLMRSRPASST